MGVFFMARYDRFTFLCDANERRAIADLAARLQRSQSDAVRFVVTEAARQLSQAQDQPAPLALPVNEPQRGGENV
jgi:hypothetical protein